MGVEERLQIALLHHSDYRYTNHTSEIENEHPKSPPEKYFLEKKLSVLPIL
nr:hypothetical protein [uncultured Pontibacter sp.]